MRFPNWLRLIWWGLVLIGLSLFLAQRLNDVAKGVGTPFDIVAFLVWIALLISPIFAEVKLFGVGFKHELERLKNELKTDIASVRAEVTAAVTNSFAPQIVLPQPPPDTELPEIEARVSAAVDAALRARGQSAPPAAAPSAVEDLGLEIEPTDDIKYLFSVRYNIEQLLRDVAVMLNLPTRPDRPIAITQLTRMLSDQDVIAPSLSQAIRDVNAICSRAIHGQGATPAQVAFVRDVTPQLVTLLWALSKVPRPAA